MFSLSIDRDAAVRKSARAYARIWHWGRVRVAAFLERVDGEICGTSHPTSDRATRNRKGGPEVFMYVGALRRSQGHSSTETRATDMATTKDPNPRVKNKSPRKAQPWHGKTRDLDRLLACEPYVQHLARSSPVLAKWSSPQIQAWARTMIAKGNAKRSDLGKSPITSFAHFLGNCVRYTTDRERPATAPEPQPAALHRAAEAMSL